MTINLNKIPRSYNRNPDSGIRDSNIYIGIVKKNVDSQFMGRIAVHIPELGGDPTNEQNWFIIRYASPFAGVTSPNSLVQNSTDMDGSQSSYGFWMQPPDLENQVLVCFANGNSAMGFWFACVWQQNMNHMVPGLASGTPATDASRCGAQPPVVEYNKWSNENPDNPKRPIFTPLDTGLSAQGLYHDQERGPSSTSARRESPSKVFGYLTPRGNSIHVDDNPANEFIRMRTRSGAQVLVNETTGFVYINSKQGNSWVEISDTGIDIYSRGSVSLRSEGSLNLHADGSLNIEADGNLNLRAGGNLTFQSAHHTNFAGNGDLVLDFGGQASTKAGGSILLDAGGSLRQGAGGTISQSSAGDNIRSSGGSIYDNTSPSAPAPGAPSATVEQPRDLAEVNGEAPCFTQDTRKTIVRRLPTHEPFTGHPAIGAATPTALSATEFASAADAASTANSSIVPAGGEAADISNLNPTDLDWLACCILDEAGNQPDDGKAGVAQVVKNRMACKQASDGTIKGTILWPNQFSGFYYAVVNGKYSRVCSDSTCAEQRGLQKIATYEQNAAKWAAAKNIGQQVMAGTYSGGDVYQKLRANKRATMYLNVASTQKLNPSGLPSWASASNKVGDISAHSFYYA